MPKMRYLYEKLQKSFSVGRGGDNSRIVRLHVWHIFENLCIARLHE